MLFRSNYLRCLIALREYDKAEKLVKKVQKRAPDNPGLLVDLGYVYFLEGAGDKSKETYEKALKSIKPDRNSVLAVANGFMMRHEIEYAVSAYLEGKKLLKGEYGFFFELADVYYQKSDYAEMINEYLDAVADNPMVQQQVLNILQSRIGYDPENKRPDLLRTALLRRIQRNPDQTYFSEMLIWL